MIEPAGNLVQSLMQRATKRYVQLLDAATDRQDRQVPPDRFPDQRQSRCIALRVVANFGVARLGPVMARMDIRRATGKQQSVEPAEDSTDIDLRSNRRDQYRETSCCIDHRARVSLVDPVESPLVDCAEAARDADERCLPT